ncbi:MAG: magnesium/cobalt transporter CorA [Spirochaetales bacterium]|jgi:magnesium transporter|nr:magnesium/cobalt transporter CorA [Spirochaetales bacterium]
MSKNRIRIRTSKKTGLPPGSLVHVGERRMEEPEIFVIDFDESGVHERGSASVDECIGFVKSKTVTWINIVGLHDVSLLKEVGEKFKIHPLIMEDILNTEQRPKVQEFGDYLFLILKMVRPDESDFETEQVSIILMNQCVITFQEQRGDVFDVIRDRIQSNKGKIRKSKADYLLYSLFDSIVDAYFPYLEAFSEALEEAEEGILASRNLVSLQGLYDKRRELIAARKAAWPMREVAGFFERAETELIGHSTNIYFKDLQDHIVQIIDTMESLRDAVTGLLELNMSTQSYKMNEVMKVLTIIATIFIPLTFVAGVYGMNFKFMPELAIRIAYPIVLIVMGAIALGMIIFFRRKKWL